MRQRAAASLLYQSQYAEPAFRNLLNLIFLKIVGRILAFYRSLPIDAVLALDDNIATAKCLATRGKAGNGNFEALQNGINRLKSFMYLGKYYIEQASADAAKAAYLAAVIKHNLSAIEKYDNGKSLLKTEKKLPAIITKMLMSIPEAYFYWSKYTEIEDF